MGRGRGRGTRRGAGSDGIEGGQGRGRYRGEALGPRRKARRFVPGTEAASPSNHDAALTAVLEPLSTAELSAKYGKGFELLRRMGFRPGLHGLREGALGTPLQAHDQGSSRRGVQGVEERHEVPEDEVQIADCASGRPLPELLEGVLRSMREAGDHEEAAELGRLATILGVEELLAADVLAGGASSSSDSDEEESEHPPHPREAEAVAAVARRLSRDERFPVELLEQSRCLLWGRRWGPDLGEYEAFVERRHDAFRVVRCPAPGGALVLPVRWQPAAGTSWDLSGKYVAWCRRHRLAASGQQKRKWRHVEAVVSRLCVLAAGPLDEDNESLHEGEQQNEGECTALDDVSVRLPTDEREEEQQQEEVDKAAALSWYEDKRGSDFAGIAPC